MAATYAALVSLTHLIEQTMDHHARQPIFLDKQQQRQIESLQQKVSFLQDFVEVYSHGSSNEAESLESRIADVAYAAEDIIESHVVDKISLEKSSNDFSQSLQKVMENIDCIRNEVIEVKEKSRVEDQQPHNLVAVVSSRPPPTRKDTMMEYYDEDLIQIMDKLTGQSSDLQIIPIVGMGGIGKSTLARNLYENPLIVECFDIRAWVTISQEYNLLDIFSGLLNEIGVSTNKGEQESSEYHRLGEKLYKHLSGRKYLIIIDDIWSIDACEKLKLFLPNNNNGSRVMATTRLTNVADSFGSSHLYKMNLLDENKSWSLLCRNVFGHGGSCPTELVEIGKDIAKNCNGLPLSIVVIGGLLAKSEMTLSYWEYVSKYINQIVNSEDNRHWFKILLLSYNHLPIHLKPCFLYMGVYPEDCEVHISRLIKLWVAEGFLKPNKAKSLEEVAEDYLKDLIERNLIFVRRWGSIGKMKSCSIHDLLRDLCLKEAQKERFLCVYNPAQPVNNMRRIVFHKRDTHQFDPALQSTTFIHSLPGGFDLWSSSWESLHNMRLLRVLTAANRTYTGLESIFQLVNLRYLKCTFLYGSSAVIARMSELRYLQMLILPGLIVWDNFASIEIWDMPHLRHLIVNTGIYLPDPLCDRMDEQDDCVLKNLQTLGHIINFKCTEEVVKRIPNIKKLSIAQTRSVNEMGTSNDYYCLHNLGRLYKLQSLSCNFYKYDSLFQYAMFPQSLNKLTLISCSFDWDDFTEKVGSLPLLEKLKLHKCSVGAEWNTVEGKFLGLKFLEIGYFDDLVCWTAESTHFPLLQSLVLKQMTELKKIPSGIGETLQSIDLYTCQSSVIASAKEIVEEQQSLGNEALRLTMVEDEDIEEVDAQSKLLLDMYAGIR